MKKIFFATGNANKLKEVSLSRGFQAQQEAGPC